MDLSSPLFSSNSLIWEWVTPSLASYRPFFSLPLSHIHRTSIHPPSLVLPLLTFLLSFTTMSDPVRGESKLGSRWGGGDRRRGRRDEDFGFGLFDYLLAYRTHIMSFCTCICDYNFLEWQSNHDCIRVYSQKWFSSKPESFIMQGCQFSWSPCGADRSTNSPKCEDCWPGCKVIIIITRANENHLESVLLLVCSVHLFQPCCLLPLL